MPLPLSPFPDYDNPVAAGPSVLVPLAPPCAVVPLFSRVVLRGWGQVETARFAPPADCPGPWSEVRLDFEGEVAGVQFDRMGALWLGGVHLLRTTTPEPVSAGIRWQLQRDLTDYSPLFRSPSNATLQIDNVVDDTYTGELIISAKLTFYRATVGTAAAQPLVLPLNEIAGASAGKPWDSMRANGDANKSYTLTLPVRNLRLAHVDVYASGHGCEEFWYTNVPDDDNVDNDPSVCDGGAYREVQLYIDGLLAGALYPFPVIYTGGVCPLLWRPLTGVYSFNVPPYRFDITPFLGLLNDGKAHEVTAKVFGNGRQGTWFLDMVLVGSVDPLHPVLEGRLLEHVVVEPTVTVTRLDNGGGGGASPIATDGAGPAPEEAVVRTTGSSSLRVSGILAPQGALDSALGVGLAAMVTTVQATLSADNENRVGGEGVLQTGVSSGLMEATVDRATVLTSARPVAGGLGAVPAVPLWQRVSEFRYPYVIGDASGQDNYTMALHGDVTQSSLRAESAWWWPAFWQVAWPDAAPPSTSGSNAVAAAAAPWPEGSGEAASAGRKLGMERRGGEASAEQREEEEREVRLNVATEAVARQGGVQRGGEQQASADEARGRAFGRAAGAAALDAAKQLHADAPHTPPPETLPAIPSWAQRMQPAGSSSAAASSAAAPGRRRGSHPPPGFGASMALLQQQPAQQQPQQPPARRRNPLADFRLAGRRKATRSSSSTSALLAADASAATTPAKASGTAAAAAAAAGLDPSQQWLTSPFPAWDGLGWPSWLGGGYTPAVGGSAAVGATAAPGGIAAEAVALGNLSWSYRVAASAVYNRSTGADRTLYETRGASSHDFSAPAACFAQHLTAKDGEVTVEGATDGCPLSAARTQLCRRFDACGAGHVERLPIPAWAQAWPHYLAVPGRPNASSSPPPPSPPSSSSASASSATHSAADVLLMGGPSVPEPKLVAALLGAPDAPLLVRRPRRHGGRGAAVQHP